MVSGESKIWLSPLLCLPLLTGVSIGDGIVTGEVSLIRSYKEISRFKDSTILVSETANTGWIGTLRKKQAKALVTDLGGRNSHAAIVSRELGIPGILSTRRATEILKPGQIAAMTRLVGILHDKGRRLNII